MFSKLTLLCIKCDDILWFKLKERCNLYVFPVRNWYLNFNSLPTVRSSRNFEYIYISSHNAVLLSFEMHNVYTYFTGLHKRFPIYHRLQAKIVIQIQQNIGYTAAFFLSRNKVHSICISFTGPHKRIRIHLLPMDRNFNSNPTKFA